MVGNNSNLEIFNRIKETNSNNADEYSNSKTYVKDEYCIYNNTLYKANQAINTAEEFTESHWTETTVGTELKSQADSISSLNSSYELSNVQRMRFQVTSDNRALFWFYVDAQGQNGFRIDFLSNPKIIQFRSVTGGSSEVIGSIQMQ